MNGVIETENSFEHGRKEKDVRLVFESQGFSCIDTSYHHLHSKDDYDVIRRCNDTTALAYRTASDFIACLGKNTALYAELKVGTSQHFCYIEAFPLALHVLQSYLGIRCLYIYAGRITDGELVACFAEDILPNKLVIPQRNSKITPYLLQSFTCSVEYRETATGTSGDAFVMVSASRIRHWKPLRQVLADIKKDRP